MRKYTVWFGFAVACAIGAGWVVPAYASDLVTSFEESQSLGDTLSGKIEKRSYSAPALGVSKKRRVYVYTPPGYSATGARELPVMILLHGTPGDAVEWLFRGGVHKAIDAAIVAKKLPPFVAVFPDGKGPFYKGGSEWADAVGGKSAMETAVSRDLVAWLKKNYTVSENPAKWAIGGLSAGGFGAANFVVRHPDTFRTGIILSGEFSVSDDWPDTKDVWGTDPAVRAAYSPIRSLHKLAPGVRSQLFFYVAVGQDDDDALVRENEAFDGVCRSLGVPINYDTDRGGHSWGFWSGHLQTGLLEWAKRLRAAKP